MSQTAAQNAPQKGTRPSAAPKQRRTGGQSAPKDGLKKRLHDLPQAAGVAIMLTMLIAALFIGNFRALQSATPADFIRQGDVRSIVQERIEAAGNAATIAERAGLTGVQDVRDAAKALEKAKTAREISRANQALQEAVSALTTAPLTGEDARSMLYAADDFAETGSFLRQEARAYNEKAEKAVRLYEKLPTKFVLPEPDVYEGL